MHMLNLAPNIRLGMLINVMPKKNVATVLKESC